MGWWEADFSQKQYVCSDFLRELLNLGEDGVIYMMRKIIFFHLMVQLMRLHLDGVII